MNSIVRVDVTIAAPMWVNDPQESADLPLVLVLNSLGRDKPKKVVALPYEMCGTVADKTNKRAVIHKSEGGFE